MKTKFIIWSNEHQAWWRGGYCGYTDRKSQAGFYTLDEASRICFTANKGQSFDALPNEMMFPIEPRPAQTITI